eukprot:Nitzschia sp. Nitz4//scaffold267_size26297//3123//6168//NITZ4_008265-RA/size26297-augustus-gene-0.19-mRNA-1//-1//CDS//3329544893//234//frame0
MSLVAEIEGFFVEEFVAFQRDEENWDQVAPRVSRIVKQVHRWKKDNLDDVESVEIAVSDILVKYLHATLSLADSTSVDDPEQGPTTSSSEKSAVADCMLELIASLAVQAESPATLEAISGQATEAGSSHQPRVRASATKCVGHVARNLLQKTLPALQSGSSIEETNLTSQLDTLKKACSFVVLRLTDKSVPVRTVAIISLGQLLAVASAAPVLLNEMAHLSTDEMFEELLWNVWHDTSVANRVQAVASLPISNAMTSKSLDHIIPRLRDVKEKVRVAAANVLAKVPLSSLDSSQMAEIVQSGLSTRCPASRQATETIICTQWMKGTKFSLLKLLNMLDVVNNESDAAKTILVVFSQVFPRDMMSNSDTNQILASLSAPEIRALCDTVKKEMMDWWSPSEQNEYVPTEQLLVASTIATSLREAQPLVLEEKFSSQIFPDIAMVCDLFQKESTHYMQSIEAGNSCGEDRACFSCLHLLSLASSAASAEEGSRRRLTALLVALLTNLGTPDDLVEGAVTALRIANAHSQTAFLDAVSEILALLHSPESYVDGSDPSLGTLRILAVLSIVLEGASPSAALKDFLESGVCASVILEAVDSFDSKLIQEAGVSCLGKMGLYMDSDIVLDEHVPRLMNFAANTNSNVTLAVQGQALMALVDWGLLLGDAILQSPREMEESEGSKSLVNLLGQFLGSRNSSVVAIAAEAASKLLFSGRIFNSEIIGRLLVAFFNPKHDSAEEECDSSELGSIVRMQQLLSLFFPAYALQSLQTRESILGSLGFALGFAAEEASKEKELKGRKRSKKGSAFPYVRVVEYVCEVTTAGGSSMESKEGDEEVMENRDDHTATALLVSLQIACFLATSEDNALTVSQIRSLCKLLGSFQVVDSDEKIVRGQVGQDLMRLQEALEILGMVITDNQSLAALECMMSDVADLEFVNDGNTEESNGAPRYSDASTITENTNPAADMDLDKENVPVGLPTSKSLALGSPALGARVEA